MDELQRIAVVIDADNTQLSKIGGVLREISTYGRIVVKRAYGNWKKQTLKNWEAEIKRHAIKAEQQFDYVSGKNATDMALVIDTIELLFTNLYDGFVIVSSDSDYTPLAIKLRESGVFVIGVGEKKTPISFKNACDEFLLLENIITTSETSKVKELLGFENENSGVFSEPADEENTDVPAEQDDGDGIEEIHSLLKIAFNTYKDDDGFANLAPVGAYIKRAKPDFDCRTYGFEKLPELLREFPEKYQVTRYPGKGTVTIVAYKCLE